MRTLLALGLVTSLFGIATADDKKDPTAGKWVIESVTRDDYRSGTVGIAEVSVPGVAPRRWLRLPSTSLQPDTILLTRGPGDRNGCVPIGGSQRCDPRLVRAGEERASLNRLVELPTGARYRARLTARARPGAALESLLWKSAPVRVKASSRSLQTVEAAPMTVLDDDLGTGWVAAADDPRPRLTLTFDRVVRADSVSLRLFAGLAAARPGSVRIGAGGVSRTVRLDSHGNGRFPSLTGRVFTLDLARRVPAVTMSTRDGVAVRLPAGVSELRLGSGSKAVTRTAPIDGGRIVLSCGQGPEIDLNGTRVQTSGRSTRADLFAGRPVQLSACNEEVQLEQGLNRIALRSGPALDVTAGVFDSLQSDGVASPDGDAPHAHVPPGGWGAVRRQVELGSRERLSIVAVGENFNPSWRARAGRTRLEPVQVNGWQQAWAVPIGDATTVDLTYTPDRLYRTAIMAGLLAFLLVMLLAAWPTDLGDEPDPPLKTLRPHPAVVAAGGLVVLGFLGGWTAVLAGGTVLLVGQVARRVFGTGRADVFQVVAAAAGLGLGGVAYALRPWGTTAGVYAGAEAWPQVAAIVSVAAVLTSGASLRVPAVRNRRSGVST